MLASYTPNCMRAECMRSGVAAALECPQRPVRVGRRMEIIRTILAGMIAALVIGPSWCRAQSPSATGSELLQQATRALNAEEYTESARLAKLAADSNMDSAAILQQSAEIIYLSGQSDKSLPYFDRVVELRPETAAENWQRGIAQCTSGQFERGAEQFKLHHDVNPDDVENSAWYFLCIAKTQGLEAARQTVIPSRGDRRQPMMSVLKMLKGEIEPEDVLKSAVDASVPEPSRPMAQFYADLYVGLYYDSLGNAEQAAKFLERSQTYGRSGYMVRTAKVYLDARFNKK
jgi:lipoprotein NlpI